MDRAAADPTISDSLNASDETIVALARQLRDLLRQQSRALVLAESCTAGRVAATLSMLPGISQWLCGSFVVYRNGSKTAWLDVPAHLLDDPKYGPVSPEVTRMLAVAALQHTPEADLSIAVTGDVGPGAAASTDGVVFVAGASRHSAPTAEGLQAERTMKLLSPAPRDAEDLPRRLARLEEATLQVLRFAISYVSQLD